MSTTETSTLWYHRQFDRKRVRNERTVQRSREKVSKTNDAINGKEGDLGNDVEDDPDEKYRRNIEDTEGQRIKRDMGD